MKCCFMKILELECIKKINAPKNVYFLSNMNYAANGSLDHKTLTCSRSWQHAHGSERDFHQKEVLQENVFQDRGCSGPSDKGHMTDRVHLAPALLCLLQETSPVDGSTSQQKCTS